MAEAAYPISSAVQIDPQQLRVLSAATEQPFWYSGDFYISTLLAIVGIIISWNAYREAGRAKTAALEAGKSVKVQTVTIELSEIAQRLDKLEIDIEFSEARDLLTEVTRRLRRLTSPFQNDSDLQETVKALKAALDELKAALDGVRPDNSEDVGAPNAVYYAVQGGFAAVNGLVADLMGLMENKTIQAGASNGNT